MIIDINLYGGIIMSNKPIKKRINFFQVQAYALSDKKKKKMSKEDIRQSLTNIYNDLEANDDKYKFKNFEMFSTNYIIEFIKLNDSELFARIGKQANENTIGKRDFVTGNLINIELQDNENIESYTYLYLDFSNMILSYLVLSGTPSKTIFSNFINDMIDNVEFTCVPITTDDVIRKLASKSTLGTIEFSYCNPKNEVIKDIPGINKRSLQNLNTDKSVITVSLRPARSKSITHRIEDIFNIKEILISEHGDNLKSLKLNAKNEEEEMINYNLLDYKFSTYTYIDMLLLNTADDFYKIIIREYNNMKNTLEDYIQ